MTAQVYRTGVFLKPDLYFVIPGDLQTLTGGYAYGRNLIAALRAAGFRVHHITLSASFPTPDQAALADAKAQLATLPDHALVLIDGLAYGAMEMVAEQEHQRLRIIALCHHPLALESGLDPETSDRLFRSEKKALMLAHAIIVTSSATAILLEERFDISATKITVALPGTAKQTFARCQGCPPRLLTVATLTRRKAHDILLAALARIGDQAWTARFVGGLHFDPAWALELQQQSTHLGLNDRIDFVGSVDDLNAEYAAADIFVLPSRFEGYGMVFAEALSFGLPIVAARSGAVPEVVPASAGVLVPPDDIDALATALQRVLDNPDHFQTLRHGAQAAAADLPAWQDTAACVIDVMTSITGNTCRDQTQPEAHP